MIPDISEGDLSMLSDQEFEERLLDTMQNSILNESDEEIREDIRLEGEYPEKVAERGRQLIAKAISQAEKAPLR